MSTIAEVLQKVHVRYEKNTDYPESSSEDFIVRLAYGDDGINEWEKEAKNGVPWPELKEDESKAATGNGSDPLPSDFLEFIRSDEKPAVIKSGDTQWKEVSMQEGNRMKQDGYSPNVFWVEGSNIITLPAITGTIEFPYLRKMTRYPLGTESDPVECDDKYLQEYILAQLYLDDKNMMAYQSHAQAAKDILDTKKFDIITQKPTESSWGFGM